MTAQIQIMRAAWQQNRNHLSGWMVGVIGLLLVGPLAVTPWAEAVKIVGAEVGLLAFVCWLALFSSLWEQNHPHAARLVPGHVRHLRQVLLASWLGMSLFTAAVLGSQFGHAAAWGLGCAVLAVLWAVSVRWLLLWLLWLAAIFPGILIFKATPIAARRALGAQMAALYSQAPLLIFAAAVLLLAWPLSRLLLAGGPAHQRRYVMTKRVRMANAMQNAGKSVAPKMFGSGVEVGYWRLVSDPFVLWRQHLVKAAQPTERSVLARAELALAAHWTHSLRSLLQAVVVIALAFWLANTLMGVNMLEKWKYLGIGLTAGLSGMVISQVAHLRTTLYASRREQALLMLLPGMPQGAALNRRLARRHLLQFGAYWLLILLVFLLVPPFAATAGGISLMMLALPLGLLALRDRSRQPSTQTASLSLGAWVGVATLVLQRDLDISPGWGFPLIALIALATLILGVWRWRKLAGNGQAFPVGRWS